MTLRPKGGRPSTLVERVRAAYGRRGRATPGQALIWFALTITLLIMCVAIVTDTGQIWINRRYLQNAADAAALAGVQQLPNDAGGARSIACNYATTKNAVAGMTVACDGADITIFQSHSANDTIRVTTHKTVTPLIGGLFGWPNVAVNARASALVGSAYQACPFPIFQTPEMLPAGQSGTIGFYTLTALHLAGADNQKGNFLTVDVGSGANAILDAMVHNTCGQPIGPTASTEPGGKIGKVVDGFQWRVACATGGPTPNGTPACPAGPSACPNPDATAYLVNGDLNPAITRDNCTRLAILPIFPGPFSGYNGNTTVTILGFAVFYIAGICPNQTCNSTPFGALKKGDAWGYYVRMDTTGTSIKPYDGYGTKAAVLCDAQC
jgi:Flp pilus assembly protein TadG